MTIYHKLINGNMLNNYELGDISLQEALGQGYKPLIQAEKEPGKNYIIEYAEEEMCIKEVITGEAPEYVIPGSQE